MKLYPTMRVAEHDAQAGQTVLHALQKGALVAYRGTSPVSRDFWIDKTPQYLRDASDFFFQREHVLALWPDPRAQKSRLPPIKPLRGSGATPVIGSIPRESRAANPEPTLRYVSEDERGRRLYRTLPQWAAIVQPAASCELADAQQQILDGLSDGKFAVRWEENDGRRVVPALTGDPPPWHEAEINWTSGKVYCDRGLTAKGLKMGLARWLTPLLTPKMGTVFERMLAEYRKPITDSAASPNAAAKPARRGGRKKGSGSIDDAERLHAMLDLLADGQASAVHDAARKVADLMVGSGQSQTANVARLRRKFAKSYGIEPPARKTWADVRSELNAN